MSILLVAHFIIGISISILFTISLVFKGVFNFKKDLITLIAIALSGYAVLCYIIDLSKLRKELYHGVYESRQKESDCCETETRAEKVWRERYAVCSESYGNCAKCQIWQS